MSPPAVCFDAYGTLVHAVDPVGRLADLLTASTGRPVSRHAAGQAFAAEVAYYRLHAIEGTDEPARHDLVARCAAVLGEELSRHVPHRLAGERLAEILLGALRWELCAGAMECLSTLAGAGAKMAVVSNWDCSLPRVLRECGIAERFRAVVASAAVGFEKPDPRIWRPALEALGVEPSSVWHIGDEPLADVAGASAAGLRPVLVGPAPCDAPTARIAGLGELPGLLGLRA